ncbi:hypothetical protein GDO86_000353 [Hymenochirus boettgeri]|uniref:glycerophosphocholine cholinephosphodiesterase n=1 Tax=Hymenochirus boettgeri TaxID=247094 RepID=A0A8T2KCV8_9PIPI|nr:hypothetical protein GDO86_000353 [Hymenochirus boettgeri]
MAMNSTHWLTLLTFCLVTTPPVHPKLLVFLIDGFRFDYISETELGDLPGFQQIIKNGVKADSMIPDFPSLSYPNYYTLMTGRHCEVHQITGNFMWDREMNISFDIGTNDDSRLPQWWDGAEPLWVTMEKAKKKVSMYYWPGCEVEILGVKPSYCREYFYYPSELELENACYDALRALKTGNAEMAAVYYERIDVEGHHHGPLSEMRKDATRKLDQVLQVVLQQIKIMDLEKDVNVMLFSDHGMTEIFWMDKVIELVNYIDMRDIVQIKDRGAVVSLWPAEGKLSKLYQQLRVVDHLNVYQKEDIPERFHYKKGKFVSPLTLVADSGWFIVERKEKLPFWNNGTSTNMAWQHGWHGYDNELMDMSGVFLAYGPDFKVNYRSASIRSTDVYNIMCNVLGIKSLPNNGSWSKVEHLLRNRASLSKPVQLMTLMLLLSVFTIQV